MEWGSGASEDRRVIHQTIARRGSWDSLWPHGLQPTRLLCSWDFPRKNTRVGGHAFFQGMLLTQGSNLHLLHQQVDSLLLSHQRNPVRRDVYNCLPSHIDGVSEIKFVFSNNTSLGNFSNLNSSGYLKERQIILNLQSHLPLAQNNLHAKGALLGEAHSESYMWLRETKSPC